MRNLALLAGLLLLATRAAAGETVECDLSQMSMEELMNVEVTSVAKRPEKLSQTASAVYVVTGEDIRRQGVTDIPDALRMVPGLHVAQVDSSRYSVSIRGFNGIFSNKLLVIVDGRCVYTPVFSGVYWDIQDMVLQDIERIEVIRGPGSTVWGANATNGVINIITKNAKETQGAYLETTAGTGNEETGTVSMRYGGKINEWTHFRVFAKGIKRDGLTLSDGTDGGDDWDGKRCGFRLDSTPSEIDAISVQGEIYDYQTKVDRGNYFRPDAPYTYTMDNVETQPYGGNFVAKWSRQLSEDSNISLQAYYDRNCRPSDREHFDTAYDETADVDFQHSFVVFDRHKMMYGLGYRSVNTVLDGIFSLQFDPVERHNNLCSAFVQDEIELAKEKLFLTLGSKFERNDSTGFEYQPGARLLWSVNRRNSLWCSVTRAVRTPAVGGEDATILLQYYPAGSLGTGSPNAFSALVGNHDVESESMMAYEIGFRTSPRDNLSFDLSTFYNRYDDLVTMDPQSTLRLASYKGTTYYLVPLVVNNNLGGDCYGAELSTTWRPVQRWKLSAGYSYMEMRLDKKNHSSDDDSWQAEKQIPQNMLFISSNLNLPHAVELDLGLRYVDALAGLDIPSYTTADFRLGWKPRENMDLSLIGRNLLDVSHPEYKQTSVLFQSVEEVERSLCLKFSIWF